MLLATYNTTLRITPEPEHRINDALAQGDPTLLLPNC